MGLLDEHGACTTRQAMRPAGPALSGDRSDRPVSAARTMVAAATSVASQAELLDHHIERAEFAAMTQNTSSMLKEPR